MPKKINVVSLSDIKPIEVEDDTVQSNDELNQIKEAIKEEEALNPPEDNPVEEASKPKPKRKPPVKKPKVVEEQPPESAPEPVVEPVVEPVKEEVTQKKVKTLELVECPNCHKQMTKRTLRYDHRKTCPGEKVEREKIPVQRRIKKEVVETKRPPAPIRIPEEIIEQEVKKRILSSVQDRLHQRLKLKEEKIKKLATQIA